MDRNKTEWRKHMASLSFSEKIKILEMLRAPSRVIAAAGLRKQAPPEADGDSETSQNPSGAGIPENSDR